MNRRLALIIVACMIGALLLMAAGPIPEKPLKEFTGTISCDVTKQATHDAKEKVHDTSKGEKQACVISTDQAAATGKMALKEDWADFNTKQKGAGYETQKFRLTTADGTWEGLLTTRVDNKGIKGVNGVGHGETGPYVGQKIYFRVAGDGTIYGWITQHGKDSLHADKHPGW